MISKSWRGKVVQQSTAVSTSGWARKEENTKKRRKKIALFLPRLSVGGAEQVMVNLANGLNQKGYQVDMVLTRAEGRFIGSVVPGVCIIDLKARRVRTSWWAFRNYLHRECPSIVLSGLREANLIAILAMRIRFQPRIPVIVIEQSMLSTSTASGRGYKRWLPGAMRWLYPKVDRIIAVSQGVRDDLNKTLDIPQQLTITAYNPIVDKILMEKAMEPLNHPWFTSLSPPVILSVGRLTQVKDYPTLLKAFALVREKVPARLVILGQGEEHSNLEALGRDLGVAESIDMPGFVENPYQYMAKATIFVLSSKWEGLPTVLVEAMACGTPVISADCPSGPREILEDGKIGVLVPVGDVSTMASAILDLLNNLGRQRELAEKGLIRATSFSIDRVIRKYDLLIRQILEGANI